VDGLLERLAAEDDDGGANGREGGGAADAGGRGRRDLFGALEDLFGGGAAHSERCMAPVVEETLHVAVSQCDALGKRTVDTTFLPINKQHCHLNLAKPKLPECAKECGAGHALLWHHETLQFQCTKCPAGTFSVGGGYIQQYWPRGLPVEFETACFSLDPDKFAQGQETWREGVECEGWRANANGTAITSGNNTGRNYLESYLILNLRFVRPGSLWFRYRVDAEEFADGLIFRLDDVAQPLAENDGALVWRALDARLFRASVGIGWHSFKWIYYKDVSRSVGKDMVELLEIGYNGTQFAAYDCQPCPLGMTSTHGATRCTSCARNQIWDDALSRCTECPVGKYAPAGAGACFILPPCTADDYRAVYSVCVQRKRQKSFEWFEPKLCTEAGGIPLPPAEADVACGACNPGFMLSPQGSCHACLEGTFSPGGGQPCVPCPAGTEAKQSLFLTEFTAWPRGFSTGCEGQCGSDGWRLRETFVDAGSRHGTAQVWLQMDLVLAAPGKVVFEYEITCADEEMKLMVHVDAGPPELLCGEGSRALDLSVGKHAVRWMYSQAAYSQAGAAYSQAGAAYSQAGPPATPQGEGLHVARIHQIVVDGVQAGTEGLEAGGAHECKECQPGFFAGQGWTGSGVSKTFCEPCPAGQTSLAGIVYWRVCKYARSQMMRALLHVLGKPLQHLL